MKERLDARVARELKVTRTKAAAIILAGEISVGDQPARKPGQMISIEAVITHTGSSPTVSRAAGKLAAALDAWPITVKGSVALDVGSSTGGFTQVLLERGATRVYAVDVGRGQLAWRLRQDPRVEVHEQTNICDFPKPTEPIELVTIDVSFTSLRTVLPAVAELIAPGADVIVLFKPQFEVGKAIADQFQGVITDQSVVDAAFTDFLMWATTNAWQSKAMLESPVHGSKGNRERLVHLRREG